MNIETRHAHRRRRRIVAAALVTTTLTACAQDPPKPKPLTAGSLDDRDFTRLRAAQARPHVVTPKPHRRPTTSKHRARSGHALGTLRVTAYCYTGSRTSTGTWPRQGTAAVKAATGIPYGARLRIAGVSYLVTDREPPWGVSDVDLYEGWRSDCERWASNFGIRHLRVERAA